MRTGRAQRSLVGKLRAATRAVIGISLAAALACSAPAGASAATPRAGATLHPTGALAPKHRRLVHLSKASVRAAVTLPSRVDLRTYAVPVGDQGMVGSCVAWTVDYAMLGWYSKKAGRPGQPFAPMYGYSQINGGVDGGAWPTDALDVLVAQGNDTRAHYGHDDFDWWDTPSAGERSNAAHYKISGYNVLFAGSGQPGAVTAIKSALATSHPVAIELPVRPGFDAMGSSASSVDTDHSGPIRGYHEVLGVGYDTSGLIIQNSWSTGWGAAGFGKLSWAVVAADVVEADTMNGFAADTAPPLVYSVTATPAAPTTVTAAGTTVPYTVKWVGLGNITRYTASYSVNGGASVPVAIAAKATSYTLRTLPGSTYTFSVQATDNLSRTSPTVTSASFGPTLVQASDPSITYSGTWNAGAQEVSTTEVSASASITASTRNIAWIASRANTNGAAKVYVDGVLKATVNLYALRPQSNVAVYAFDFGSVGSHTLTVVAVGTAAHPGVNVDGFLLRT